MQWLSVVFKLEARPDAVPDSTLTDSGVFPKLDLVWAQELMKVAEKGCTSIFIKLKQVRSHRLNEHSLVTGREALRFIVRFFRRTNGDSETPFD